MKDVASLDAADFCVDEMHAISKRMRLSVALKNCANDSPRVSEAKRSILREMETLEGIQFLMCERSKIVSYMVCRSKICERTYWQRRSSADVPASNDEEDASSSLSDVESAD